MRFKFLTNRKHLFFSICILSSFVFFSNRINAQTKENNLAFHQSLKQINGVYNTLKKTYYCQSIDPDNIKIRHQFVVDKFSHGYGICAYYYLNDANNFKSEKTYGLIDTTGKIWIPCIYNDLKTTGNHSFFIYGSKDSIGIVNVDNTEILKLAKYNKNEYSKQNYVHGDTLRDYCFLRFNGLFGVFSYKKAKLVVPTQFDKVNIYGNIAICRTGKIFIAYNCETGNYSEPYSEIFPLNSNAHFFVRQKNGKAVICNDAINPMESLNQQLNKEEAIEFYNNHIISRSNEKVGVIDQYGNEKIPFIYEDIYFFDEAFLLVKKNGLWAISDYKHNFRSDFQFVDVNEQNQINFKNFIRFSGIDTSSTSLDHSLEFESRSGPDKKYLLYGIQKKLITLKSELNTHKLSQYKNYYQQYVLQSKEGFQLITISAGGKEVKIDSLCWNSVFMVPEIHDYPFAIGVQKGDKYGYYNSKVSEEKYLKYDGIHFDHHLFYYDGILFSGTHNSRSPYTIVKKGYVYYHASYSKTNWLKKITSPPNWSSRYQGKEKWVKYMKEQEFIETKKK